MQFWYVDTSAVVKLVQPEAETAVLRDWLRGKQWVISDLHRTELRRAAQRLGPTTLRRAERLLSELDIITINGQGFDEAGHAKPVELRSLDALHITAAQSLGPDLAGIVAYDIRLLDASSEAGIPAISPS